MQFKFVGNPHDANDGKVSIVAYGIKFPLNVAVNVDDSFAIRKLMGNSHFAVVDGGVTFHQAPGKLVLPAVSIDLAEVPVVENVEDVKPSDLSRDEAIQAAVAYGVVIDKRWSTQRITATIAATIAERSAISETATSVPEEVAQ